MMRRRHLGFRLFASVSALPMVLFASAAFAQSPLQGAPRHANDQAPFANAVTSDELAALRGGALAPGALPAVRLWDEVGGRGQTRGAAPNGPVFNDGTITTRSGGR
jgi:hypothetical protein